MNTKIYISGAITGTDDYMERFAKAEKELTEKGYSVVNPAKVNSMMPADTTYSEYMKMSFTMLEICQVIYLLNSWENSAGAIKEREFAIRTGKRIIREDGAEDEFIKNLDEKVKEIELKANEKGEWYKNFMLQETLSFEEFRYYIAMGVEC